MIADAAILVKDPKPAGKGIDAIRREALTEASKKHANVKAVVDSLLHGDEIAKAKSDQVEAAFLASVSIVRNSSTAVDADLGGDMLRISADDKNPKDSKANDGSAGLTGRALYVHRLTHPKARATA